MKKVLLLAPRKAPQPSRKSKIFKSSRSKTVTNRKRPRRSVPLRKTGLRLVKKRIPRRASVRSTRLVKRLRRPIINIPLAPEPVGVPHPPLIEPRPTLSVIVPLLNEEPVLPLFLESVASYADEILIMLAGSSDANVSILNAWKNRANIRMFHHKPSGLPADDWNESAARNFLLDQAVGDWIMAIDVHEIMDDGFHEALPALMAQKDADTVAFPRVQFWTNPDTIRIRAANDSHASGDRYLMWRNHIGIRYDDAKKDSKLQLYGRYMWELPSRFEPISVFQYTDAFSSQSKLRLEPGVLTKAFTGKHPSVMDRYLAERWKKRNVNG
ncbi:glycosyltransferase [Paenibacillus qinlingensis]|uniref:Glycosyltransferase involved in cell wall biosynthesis n=1 Tax=Paenibacillus qinlingensis TaxID=1837343 RepID=A0ABU1NSZ0_9BACL|nr:glycosyltransferase [Paenibacillus qinlingensis]MDR6550553.1 glycosyltransferase involved in cell wall biosynthesis [Paenibacillus qinlingensis]